MARVDDLGATQFAARVENQGETCTVELVGELDMSCVEEAKDALRQAQETDAARIVIDLDGLRFIDSHGLALLVEASRRSDGTGRLYFTRGSGHVAEMLRLTGLDQTLPFEP
jgi:anti-sigma B factor antagonist